MQSSTALLARPARPWLLPAILGCAAFAVVVAAIDPAGDYPDAPQGPGLTIDESFNVQEGVRLVEGLKLWGLGIVAFQPELRLRDLFGEERDLGPNAKMGYHNPDHPPLGRIWLGFWHNVVTSIAPPRNHPGPFVTAAARVGSAAAFAITVFLCAWTAAVWYGQVGGVVAGLSLLLMPRVFGHAHLAALETCMGCTYFLAVTAVARTWKTDSAVPWRTAALTGVAVGAAMLSKIQGVLIPIPVIVWAIVHWRLKAWRPLLIWGVVGLAVFFLFWPWLWIDPLGHFLKYLRGATNRSTLYVWYFGTRYADQAHPWHYCLVMCLTTVPIGLQALGALGLFAKRPRLLFAPHEQLVLGAMLFPVLLFSVPRVSVYDGARLFLVVFPLWALFIGRGGALAWEWLRTRLSLRPAFVVAGVFLVGQGWGVLSTWPSFLTYYNGTTGGLAGAERLGLEIDYWGDAITRDFLERTIQAVPDGAQIDVAPVLHQFQLGDLREQSPVLRRRGIRLLPYDADRPQHSAYLLLFLRQADLSPQLQALIASQPALVEVRRGGVVLAGLYAQPDRSGAH